MSTGGVYAVSLILPWPVSTQSLSMQIHTKTLGRWNRKTYNSIFFIMNDSERSHKSISQEEILRIKQGRCKYRVGRRSYAKGPYWYGTRIDFKKVHRWRDRNEKSVKIEFNGRPCTWRIFRENYFLIKDLTICQRQMWIPLHEEISKFWKHRARNIGIRGSWIENSRIGFLLWDMKQNDTERRVVLSRRRSFIRMVKK